MQLLGHEIQFDVGMQQEIDHDPLTFADGRAQEKYCLIALLDCDEIALVKLEATRYLDQ